MAAEIIFGGGEALKGGGQVKDELGCARSRTVIGCIVTISSGLWNQTGTWLRTYLPEVPKLRACDYLSRHNQSFPLILRPSIHQPGRLGGSTTCVKKDKSYFPVCWC